MNSWVDFWNQDTPIYVSALHKRAHYEQVARDVVGVLPKAGLTVLDFGCGEALSADIVAAHCAKLYLCDAAALVRDRLKTSFGDASAIEICAPDALPTLPDGLFDAVIVNSVVQYLAADEFRRLLALFHRKTSAAGVLVLADVIPCNSSAVVDAAALLRFGASKGFFIDAFAGLLRTAFSKYATLRRTLLLSRYDEHEIIALLAGCGWMASRRRPNFGHNQERMTFCAAKKRESDRQCPAHGKEIPKVRN